MASIDTRSMDGRIYVRDHKVRKMAKIRNQYLTQDTNGKATTLHITKESQEVSPIPAGDQKAPINIRARKHNKKQGRNNINDPRHKSIRCGSRRFREEDF